MSEKTLCHLRRVEIRDGYGRVVRGYCPYCWEVFPSGPRGYITDDDGVIECGFMRPRATDGQSRARSADLNPRVPHAAAANDKEKT